MSDARADILEEAAELCDREEVKHFVAIGTARNEDEKHKHGAKCAMAMELAAHIRALKDKPRDESWA